MSTVVKFDVTVTPLNKVRKIHLYLPTGYELSQDHYPVLYMYDGHNLYFDADATYGKSWGLKDYLDHCPQPFICVGIECGHEGDERLSEYCPFDLAKSPWGELKGNGTPFMKWLVNELKPMIDERFRTIPDRDHTFIGGSSMGGLMALYSVIHYNNVFSKAACVSSAISYCYYQLEREINKAYLNPNTKVYMSWGSQEMGGHLAKGSWVNLHISHMLTERGVNTYPNLVVDGRHCEADWEKEVPVFMEYLWK